MKKINNKYELTIIEYIKFKIKLLFATVLFYIDFYKHNRIKSQKLNLDEFKAYGYFKRAIASNSLLKIALVFNNKDCGICLKDKKMKIVTHIYTAKNKERTLFLFKILENETRNTF